MKHQVDALIVGAGFSGLYMLHKLKELGMNAIIIEAADGVGGVWYWNRYPGARCDSESFHYNFTFSEELFNGWKWKSRYSTHSEIRQYLNYVADQLQLKNNILFSTKVTNARFSSQQAKWMVQLNNHEVYQCKYFITAVGNISATNVPNIKGLEHFSGEWYHTGNWPQKKVNFQGKRVGVIGTGSSGVQAIPVIAKEAKELKVFQRTPNYVLPANNYNYTEEEIKGYRANYFKLKEDIRNSKGGTPYRTNDKSALDDNDKERERVLEAAWNRGGIFPMNNTYKDILTNPDANHTIAEFIRKKIKEQVKNPQIVEKLLPYHFYNTKRTIAGTNYYETFNLNHVELIDLRENPINEITETGIKTQHTMIDLDLIVFATGYDGITGNLFKVDIQGVNGIKLVDKWEGGAAASTCLGMTTSGFPNLFFITGPESPAVLTNIPATIEQNVEWISDCIKYMEENGHTSIENTEEQEKAWSATVRSLASATLYSKTKSWYTGSNIEGKPQNILIYLGGLDQYSEICHEAAKSHYKGYGFNKDYSQVEMTK